MQKYDKGADNMREKELFEEYSFNLQRVGKAWYMTVVTPRLKETFSIHEKEVGLVLNYVATVATMPIRAEVTVFLKNLIRKAKYQAYELEHKDNILKGLICC